MPEISFVFGPNDSFFFDCPKAWKFHAIPATLRQLFNSSMAPAWRIAQPYCVALAPAPRSFKNAESLWYVGCKTLSGEDKLFYSETHFETHYADLVRWTKTLPHAPRTCFVTFGQNLSYFACATGHGSVWAGLPSELEDKLRKTFDTPSCVALGSKNAWVVIYPDGFIAWKFYGYYSALDKILKEAAPRTIAYVAISPYNKEHYFVAFNNKSIKYNFKGCPKEWMTLMTEVFDAWAAESVQKQPLPFAQPYTQPNPYAHQQPYPPAQPYIQGQHYHQAQPQTYQPVQAAYNYNSPVQQPVSPYPAHAYPSPVSPKAVPNDSRYTYRPPQAVEMPAELPGQTLLAAPVSVPVRSGSTDKKRKSLFGIF